MAVACKGTGSHVLGLTGPIGCGKTTVGDILLEAGAVERIDADRVVHDLMASDASVCARLRETFGDEIVLPDGHMDRQRLGEVVFGHPDSLRQLEAIVHPAVRDAIRARLRVARIEPGVIIMDAVKLLQSDLLPLANAVWVVKCSPDDQMARLTEARGMTPEAARARVESMPTFDHPRVSQVISNSGTRDHLRAQVLRAWNTQLRCWGFSER